MFRIVISYLGQLLQNHIEQCIHYWVMFPKISFAMKRYFFKCLWQQPS